MSEITSFELGLSDMVRSSNAPESKKSMAMAFVRNVGKISNGAREDVGRISDTLGSLSPIIIEMYLQPQISVQSIEEAIRKHLSDCPVSASMIKKMRKNAETGDVEIVDSMTWQRMLFSTLTSIGWPGALVLIVLILKDQLIKVIMPV